MIKRGPSRPPRTHIPWVRSDHHDCPDKRSPRKSMRIRADGYAKCFRCGWQGWLDGQGPLSDEDRKRANKRERARRRRNMTTLERIVSECLPITPHTPAGRYLLKRHLVEPWPEDLLYHPKLQHGPKDKNLAFPAMVALLRDVAGNLRAIHRTYLTHEGDKAPVDPVRMVLGPASGAAFLAPMLPTRTADGKLVYHGAHRQPKVEIMVCEGIEDALALRLAYPGSAAWATISSANMGLNEPPPDYAIVTVVPDNDKSGRKGARELYSLLRADLDVENTQRMERLQENLVARRALGDDVAIWLDRHGVTLDELKRAPAPSEPFPWQSSTEEKHACAGEPKYPNALRAYDGTLLCFSCGLFEPGTEAKLRQAQDDLARGPRLARILPIKGCYKDAAEAWAAQQGSGD